MSTTATNNQPEKITFQLKAIELLDSTLNHPGYIIPEPTTFHYDLRIEQKINIEEKVVFIVNEVEILNENRDLMLGSVKVNCVFGIENIMDFVDSNNTINLPDEIATTLNSITISTTRGIMYSQFKGTFLQHAYLPVIDPTAFITPTV